MEETHYYINQEETLEVFLSDGKFSLDNNTAESTL